MAARIRSIRPRFLHSAKSAKERISWPALDIHSQSAIMKLPNRMRLCFGQVFASRSAVNPIGRFWGSGGFISWRIAERMAAMA